jgi:DNA repair exonuclease SbcCD ATPase subunit
VTGKHLEVEKLRIKLGMYKAEEAKFRAETKTEMTIKSQTIAQLEEKLRILDQQLGPHGREGQERAGLQRQVSAQEEALHQKQAQIERLRGQLMQQSTQIRFFEDNFNMVQSLNQQLETENKHFSDCYKYSHGQLQHEKGLKSLGGGRSGCIKQAEGDQLLLNFGCQTGESLGPPIEGAGQSKADVNGTSTELEDYN